MQSFFNIIALGCTGAAESQGFIGVVYTVRRLCLLCGSTSYEMSGKHCVMEKEGLKLNHIYSVESFNKSVNHTIWEVHFCICVSTPSIPQVNTTKHIDSSFSLKNYSISPHKYTFKERSIISNCARILLGNIHVF
jgi:hypothetical protein